MTLLWVGRQHGIQDLIERGGREGAELLVKLVLEEDIPDEEEGVTYAFLGTPMGECLPMQRADEVAGALLGQPCKNEWLRLLLMGRYHVRRAWEARGAKWARLVTDEGWKGFDVHLNLAQEYLVRAHALDTSRPWAASQMIRVTMGGEAEGDRDERFWFDQAITARFDFRPAYDAMEWALRPRWGGSLRALRSFGLECAASERYETVVPRYLMSCVEDMGADLGGNYSFLADDKILTDALLSVLARTIEVGERVGDKRMETACREETFYVLWWAERWESLFDLVVARHDPAFSNQDLRRLWHVCDEDIPYDALLYGQNDGLTQAVRAGDAAFNEGRYADALESYESLKLVLLRMNVTDRVLRNRTESAIRDRVAMARTMVSFEAGQWTPLITAYGFEGWRSERGTLPFTRAPGKRGMTLVMNEQKTLRYKVAPVGLRFRLKGRLDMTKLKDRRSATGAVCFGHNPAGNLSYYALVLHPTGGRVGILYTYGEELVGTDVPVARDVEVDLTVWDDHVWVSLDATPVLRAVLPGPPESAEELGPYVGVGSQSWWRAGQITFRDFEIRRLDAFPAEVDGAFGEAGVALQRVGDGGEAASADAQVPKDVEEENASAQAPPDERGGK
jgi:hypothetical protein